MALDTQCPLEDKDNDKEKVQRIQDIPRYNIHPGPLLMRIGRLSFVIGQFKTFPVQSRGPRSRVCILVSKCKAKRDIIWFAAVAAGGELKEKAAC